jgi:uncharacterized protein
MVKPVSDLCNLNCAYCYYLKTRTVDGVFQRMNTDVLETFIQQYIDANPGPTVHFTWHGGEPTLAGIDFYRTVVELQKKYTPSGVQCVNNLQTNGILIDDVWGRFLAEAGFTVGLSIDGTELLHDTYRKDKAGRGTYGQAAEAIHTLQRNGIQPDLLCTVNAATAKEPIQVYRALKKFNTGWMQFIPIVKFAETGGMAVESADAPGYGKFLTDIFDEWILRGLETTGIQVFAETLAFIAGGAATVCWMAPACGKAVVVERDGGVYACDHFVNVEHFLGNITETPLKDLVNSKEQLRFGENKKKLLSDKCKICKWLYLCNGGCPKDRFAADASGCAGHNYLCEGLYHFFAHAEEPLASVSDMLKKGYTLKEIQQSFRVKELAKWAGVGRNAPCPCGSGKKAKYCCWDKKP